MSFGKLKSLVHRRKSLQGASCQSNGIVVVAVMNLSDVMTSLLKAADIYTAFEKPPFFGGKPKWRDSQESQ